MRESTYQAQLVRKLQRMFPECFILQNDPTEYQGIPDLLILFGSTWAMLEVKTSPDAPDQPNQPYYVNLFDEMSFAAFICPQSEERVLNDLQLALRTQREACLSEP